MTKTTYEWAVELMDGEDIVETVHGDTIAEAFGLASGHDDLEPVLVLIRDTGDDVAGLTDRMWAYPQDGVLPDHFTYGGPEDVPNGYAVPIRFRHQIAAWAARA